MGIYLGTGLSGGESGRLQGLKGILESSLAKAKGWDRTLENLICCIYTGPGTWEGHMIHGTTTVGQAG